MFLHNKDQIYLPKFDEIYGSDLIFLTVNQEMREAGTFGLQPYKIKRTFIKGLDTPDKRCDKDSSKANITQCITRYVEHAIGCSIGLLRSDRQAKR